MSHPPPPRPLARPSVESLEDRTVLSPAVALVPGNQLLRFDTADPATILGSASITGLGGGPSEVVLGVDEQPGTGTLFALGVSTIGILDTLRLYTLDPGTGVVTLQGILAGGLRHGNFYGLDYV